MSVPRAAWPWIALAIFSFACILMRDSLPWLAKYPPGWVIPLADAISAAMAVFVDYFQWLFRAVAWGLNQPLIGVRTLLLAMPWPMLVALFAILAHRAGGWRLVALTLMALGYMLVVGYWDESLNTLALITVSVPLSLAAGFALGVAAWSSERVDRIVQPLLDLMQTVPAFAYLIPILFLFGFGPAVGLVASAIFAAPPMVRNTILALRRVPAGIKESGLMSGCTPRQRFWLVELPTAMPQILIGVNQTIMAALSMVIIAAIIGGFDDIGWEVLSTMRKAQFGQSLLSGLVIALMAIVLDRISAGLATRRAPGSRPLGPYLAAAALAIVASLILAALVPALSTYPEGWVFYPAQPLNDAISYIVRNYSHVLGAVKHVVLFFLMMPLRIGLSLAVSPFTWGFALSPAMIWGYVGLAAALTLFCLWRGRWAAAGLVVLLATLIWFGMTGLPWPVVIATITMLAWRAGGRPVAVLAFSSLVFMLVTGVWVPAMLSIYLCGVAVAVSFLTGGAIGVWAAHSETVSRIIRPINDTLQTMPQFVLLIPVLMLFKVGEFTALLAIIAYAIVPAIRYVEHGIRSVPAQTVEAARQIGCSPAQLLFQVKLPLALPVIMLGLNQTVMYGLSMLVIAALVGTQGLGQQVFLSLGKADMGMGVITGLSMALIAMTADRILQAISRSQQARLGLMRPAHGGAKGGSAMPAAA
ncbi:MAG: ABC transporter permease subunit [Alphaproteobacteria bacterium]|nr:MAG: ABC transporter permease subunit [Alphaproteobacteria bacterium]